MTDTANGASTEMALLAAENNARWCDALCRAHGRPGELRDALWINRHAVPPFYPNVVTLQGAQGRASQVDAILELCRSGLGSGWGVKDSFCTLDLLPLGFDLLFVAEWICRSGTAPMPAAPAAGVRWRVVADARELRAWEAEWSGAPLNRTDTGQPAVFPPLLLSDPDVAVIAGYRDGALVSGGVAYRSAEAIGLSNVFAPDDEGEAARAGLVGILCDLFPGLPVVGYQRGRSPASGRGLGFESAGPLRVWVKSPAVSPEPA